MCLQGYVQIHKMIALICNNLLWHQVVSAPFDHSCGGSNCGHFNKVQRQLPFDQLTINSLI
jgi:hypothetical protein